MLVKMDEWTLIGRMVFTLGDKIKISDARNILQMLTISSVDVAIMGITQEGNRFSCEYDIGKEIDMPDYVETLIRDLLEVLNEKGILHEDWDTLYELFCGGK